MGDDWKSAGVAKVVVQRLVSISVRIENGDVKGARRLLSDWEGDLDFTEVPSSARDKTGPILNTVLSHMKATPPDTVPALGHLEKAIQLWR